MLTALVPLYSPLTSDSGRFRPGIDVGGRYGRTSLLIHPFAFRGGVMKQIFGIEIPRTLEDVCQPRRLALSVYDMQVGITSQVKDGHLIVERAETSKDCVDHPLPAALDRASSRTDTASATRPATLS